MRTKVDTRFFFPIIILAGLFFFGTTRATLGDTAPLLTANAIGQACDVNTNQCNTPQFFMTSVNTIVIPLQDASGNSASGTVAFGSLTGAVSTTGGIESSGEGFYAGFWEDNLTVTSTTLAPGTPVDLGFSLFIDTTTTCSGNGLVQTIAGISVPGNNLSFQSSACNSTFDKSGTLLLPTSVGASVFVEGQLELTATEAFGGSASIDPSANFFIDSLTSGASYTTASGSTYFTPTSSVPEPGTFVLLTGGLIMFATALRRCRS
jgi:hypothetical protein